MDADQLGCLHQMAKGVVMDENAQALDAIREVGPGGHYLGCVHTRLIFKVHFGGRTYLIINLLRLGKRKEGWTPCHWLHVESKIC